MNGQVLDFSIQTNSGTILGDDGNRYEFAGAEWRETDNPSRGMRVEFRAEGGNAVAVQRGSESSHGMRWAILILLTLWLTPLLAAIGYFSLEDNPEALDLYGEIAGIGIGVIGIGGLVLLWYLLLSGKIRPKKWNRRGFWVFFGGDDGGGE